MEAVSLFSPQYGRLENIFALHYVYMTFKQDLGNIPKAFANHMLALE